MKILDRFKKRFEATSPRRFAWSACISGLACLVVAGLHLLTKRWDSGPHPETQDAFERFLSLWAHYLSIPQVIIGLGLVLFGGSMAFHKEWGRQGLLALIRLVFLSLFVLLPGMGYGFFVFFRDKWIPGAGSGPAGPFFGYGTAIIFGIWTVFVAISMVWSVALMIRRLNDPEYRTWTSISRTAQE
jgi:hypothetical protein